MHSLITDFIDHETLKGYTSESLFAKRRHLERFVDYIGPDYIKAERKDIESYIITLIQRGISSEKINLHLTHIIQFYDYLVSKEVILINPAAKIDKLDVCKDTDSGIFTESDIKGLLQSSSTHYRRKSDKIMARDRAILELLYSTGIRLSELISLDIDDVNIRAREINICNAKGEKERIVPIGDEALSYINEYLKHRDRFIKPGKELDALFISRQGNRIAEVSVRKMVHRRKDEAGVSSKGTTHAFRRSCASHMLQNGASIESISRLLGHASIETTKEYTTVSDAELKEKHQSSHPRK